MPLRVSLFLLLIPLAEPLGAGESTPVELTPHWKTGKSVRYEMTRTLTITVDGIETRKVVTVTPVVIEVIAADASGARLRWSQGSTTFEHPRLEEPLDRVSNAIRKLLDIDLSIGPDGTLSGVINWREIRGTGHQAQDTILARMAKTGTPKSSLDVIRKETDKLLASKETIEREFATVPSLLLMPYGHEYDLGNSVNCEGAIPNPFLREELLASTGTVTLKSLSTQDGVAVIILKQSADPMETARTYRKWTEEQAKLAGKPAPEVQVTVQIDEVTECVYDTSTDWVKSIQQTRSIKEGTHARTESVTLTRKK